MNKEVMQAVSKGKLLVAMPKLNDPNFRQTVILLCEYSEDGALGVVLNRPTEMAVSMQKRSMRVALWPETGCWCSVAVMK